MRWICGLWVLMCLALGAAWASPVPDPSFNNIKAGVPTGWTPSGAATAGQGYVTVRSGGAWQSEPVALTQDVTLEMSVRVRWRPSGPVGQTACAVFGPEFAIQVLPLTEPNVWRTFRFLFTVPKPVDASLRRIRLSEWQLEGGIDYDDVYIRPSAPIYAQTAAGYLGDGESLSGNMYRFVAPLARRTPVSRPLHAYNDRFHDNRWRFTRPGSQVIYRHEIAGRTIQSARLTVSPMFHEPTSLELVLEGSTDGAKWQQMGVVTYPAAGSVSVDVPAVLLPSRILWVRLRCDGPDSRLPVFFQVTGYDLQATLSGEPTYTAGKTVPVTQVAGPAAPWNAVFHLAEDGGAIRATIRNDSAAARSLNGVWELLDSTGRISSSERFQNRVAAKAAAATLWRSTAAPGEHRLRLRIGDPATAWELTWRAGVLDSGVFGERLSSPDGKVGLWWAPSGWKIARERPAPAQRGSGLRVALAGNESEAVQLVVRPDRPLSGLTVRSETLRGPEGRVLPADCVEILSVRYVSVDIASDEIGSVGWWPDPLPPIRTGLRVEPGMNQPLWIRVTVPDGTPAGKYQGSVIVQADGFNARVPLEVQVYGFSLPARPTCKSLFGFNHTTALSYHRAVTPEAQRTVLEGYLSSFSRHKISPYNPAPLDSLKWSMPNSLAWAGGVLDTRDPAEGSRVLRVEDDNPSGNPQARYLAEMPLEQARRLRLRLQYRTADAETPAQVVLCFQDGSHAHIAYHNAHVDLPPSTTWRSIDVTVDAVPEQAVSTTLHLQACRWTEEGTGTGTVWIDAISLANADTGAWLLEPEGFEPRAPETERPVQFEWEPWLSATHRALDRYGFNSFLIHVPGLGSGTFFERHPGELGGYRQGEPEYTRLFADWCAQMEAQIHAQGWDGMVAVYPFDEPAEKDYDFVIEQLRWLKEHLPSVRRMVPMNLGSDKRFVGWVNQWCPILSSHDRAFARSRIAAGDRYTWYICCGPTAPYVANFIDRPATDLRVWLWQSWQEGVEGILIWETVWWHSPEAYPQGRQNPYEDAISWVSGYGTKPGQRIPWKAGDGRFMYPPETVFEPGDGPVLDAPVDTIRWEMLRDGVEDYEYLAMLRKRLESATPAQRRQYEPLLTVPASISDSLTRWTFDPTPMLHRRHQIATALETLGPAPEMR